MQIQRIRICAALLIVFTGPLLSAQQRMQEREEEFMQQKPLIGEMLPEVTVHNPDGTPFSTADLRGHYTVLTFGCLTCPPSMWNIAGLEAVQRDYGPTGVRFFFIYKTLAHPELAGGYVQPFTNEERQMQARHAALQFGTKIPWIVDDIDNRLKHAMGDRPNSQFLIGPDGTIIRKRAWSNPQQVRKDLEELVGPSKQITKVEDLNLKIQEPMAGAAARGVVPRLKRPQMMAIKTTPDVAGNKLAFFAKLRAEADPELLKEGTGMLYLGFHLDPFLNAHWNNLLDPLTVTIESPDGVQLEQPKLTAVKPEAVSDADPREFLIKVESWSADQPVRLVVTYAACVGEETCHIVRQEYTIERIRDPNGGGARGEGAGYWKAEEFARQMMKGDRDRDRRLKKEELVGLVSPHFDALDVNHDGFLELEELLPIADWLNHHHKPGTPNPAADARAKQGNGDR